MVLGFSANHALNFSSIGYASNPCISAETLKTFMQQQKQLRVSFLSSMVRIKKTKTLTKNDVLLIHEYFNSRWIGFHREALLSSGHIVEMRKDLHSMLETIANVSENDSHIFRLEILNFETHFFVMYFESGVLKDDKGSVSSLVKNLLEESLEKLTRLPQAERLNIVTRALQGDLRSSFQSMQMQSTIDRLFGIRSQFIEQSIDAQKYGKTNHWTWIQNDLNIFLTPYHELTDVLQRLSLTSHDVVYDMGTAYGRLPISGGFLFPSSRFKGIEFVAERAAEAQVAVKKIGLKNVEIIQGDVRFTDFSDGTVFYFYNPFPYETAAVVIDKLRVLMKNKKVRIVIKYNLSGLRPETLPLRLIQETKCCRIFESL